MVFNSGLRAWREGSRAVLDVVKESQVQMVEIRTSEQELGWGSCSLKMLFMLRKGSGEKSNSRLQMPASFPVLAKGDVRVGASAGRGEKFCIHHVAVSLQTTMR